jgi:DNA-binding SARP family transcriptional activator
MTIRVYLTGRIVLELDGEPVIDEPHIRGKQGRLASAYLVTSRDRPVPKEDLGRLLWGKELASNWETALSSLMSRTRSLLASRSLNEHGVSLEGGFGQYRLFLPVGAWTDLEAATSSIDQAESALRTGDPRLVLGPATVVLNIARRPFLAGIENEWADSQRRRLERQLLRALDCLTVMSLARGEPATAFEMATEAVEVDPFREVSCRHLMQAHAVGGDRARAAEAYRSLRKHVETELGTTPSEETEAVFREIMGARVG